MSSIRSRSEETIVEEFINLNPKYMCQTEKASELVIHSISKWLQKIVFCISWFLKRIRCDCFPSFAIHWTLYSIVSSWSCVRFLILNIAIITVGHFFTPMWECPRRWTLSVICGIRYTREIITATVTIEIGDIKSICMVLMH